MKKKNTENFGCITTYPQCIQWNLGDIPSLGIENGDYMDDLVYAIVEKLCELSDPLDLSEVSIQCLIDKLDNSEPIPRTLQSVLQLLIDNECTLKDLIDNLQSQINDINGDSLVLDLKCLAETDSFGNPADLGVTTADLQNQIDELDVTPFELPIINTCISGSKSLELVVGDVATSLCNLRTATGTELQINTAIGNQCSNFNTQFGSITGWNLAPSNLAQSYSNLELAFCNVLNRLIEIEQTCCAPSCDKIKIGFIHSYDFESRDLTLSFTSGSGILRLIGDIIKEYFMIVMTILY